MKHFAIIQTAFIGDVCLALPAAQALRNVIPDARITFITTPASAPLAGCASAIDSVLAFDKRGRHRGGRGLEIFADELRPLAVDCVLSAHRSLRTSLLVMLLGAPFSVGFRTAAGAFCYRKLVEYRAAHHETRRVLSLLEAIPGFAPVQHVPETAITIPPADVEAADRLGETCFAGDAPVIAVAPGSAWATKRWPARHFAAAIRAICRRGFGAVLLGGESDAALCSKLSAETGAISLAGQTTLPQTLRLLQRCRALLTNDSAPTHLARLAGTPPVTLFGPTVPEFGFAPLGGLVAQSAGLPCRPCAIHGGRRCPLGTHECMSGLAPEKVVEILFEKKSNGELFCDNIAEKIT